MIQISTIYKLAKKQLTESLTRQGVLFLLLLTIFSLAFYIASKLYCSAVNDYYNEQNMLFSVMIIVFVVSSVSSLFISYQSAHAMPFRKNKNQLIQFNMIPASKAEKFIVILLMPLILAIVQLTAAFFLADLIQYCFNKTSVTTIFSIPEIVIVLQNLERNMFAGNEIANIDTTISTALSLHAMYLLGAAYFKKHPFIITFAIIGIIPFIVGIFLGITGYQEFSIQVLEHTNIINIITIIICYALVYRKMNKAQL